ncbi:hypothetical protein C2845_PM02G16020 [Panicum miliaceum]|uniref:Rubisco accumulation factor 1 C-terminal domain-containing protein n=1 Tax=Panicum miliaceum TaxID=4540 RepID=A0A3L6S8X0_PANMI|nr:hypothetical protein C2845_PM02G16020 [Panicum miliaceum]
MERARKKAAGEEVEEDEDDTVARPVVNVERLQYGEVTEATTVLLLPIVRETDGVATMESVPRRTKTDLDLGIVEVDKAWARWAVVTGWGLVAAAAEEAVMVELADGRRLPWRTANRSRKEVAGQGLYILEKAGRLVVERARKLAEQGITTAAAKMLIMVRPPSRDWDDMISDEEWD